MHHRYLLAEKCFEHIDVFEQQSTIEGTWNYTTPNDEDTYEIPQTNPFQPLEHPSWRTSGESGPLLQVTTPMYDRLDTNIPHPIMQFSDKPFPKETPLFPSRQTVTAYLNEYASDIKHLLSLYTQVVDVRLKSSDRDIWLVQTKNLITGSNIIAEYDAVAVCSGHYTVPYVPRIKGLEKWAKSYPGNVGHSKLYRSPEPFRSKKVVVIGNSASGFDIASQISTVSTTPLIVSQRSESLLAVAEDDQAESLVKHGPLIDEFLDPETCHRGIRFVDGHIEQDVDEVLFCTGYLYSFPFLPSLHSKFITDGMRVHRVYQHLFFTEHPSLAFLGLPIRVLPFPLSEAQASVVSRVWSGRLDLPSEKEMLQWEETTITENGDGRAFQSFKFPKDLNYHNVLCDWASQAEGALGKSAHRWTEKDAWMRERIAAMKIAFSQHSEEKEHIKTAKDLGFDFDEWRLQNNDEIHNDSLFRPK